jgi:hypothetical protein
MWRAWALLALTAGGANAEADDVRSALSACADLLRAEAQDAGGTPRDQFHADGFLFEKAAQGFDGSFPGLADLVPKLAMPRTVQDCQFKQAGKP